MKMNVAAKSFTKRLKPPKLDFGSVQNASKLAFLAEPKPFL
jgi:hypothetical protein